MNNNTIKITNLKTLKNCRNQELWPVVSKNIIDLHHRSPEINENLPNNPLKADIYSLGVILFAMLNATFPFNFSNLKELIEDQKRNRLVMRASILHKISVECQVAVHILLEPDANLRRSCDKLLELDWLK